MRIRAYVVDWYSDRVCYSSARAGRLGCCTRVVIAIWKSNRESTAYCGGEGDVHTVRASEREGAHVEFRVRVKWDLWRLIRDCWVLDGHCCCSMGPSESKRRSNG